MATTTYFRSGPNSGSLSDQLAPSRIKPIPVQVSQQKVIKRTQTGKLYTRLQGVEKLEFEVDFTTESKTDFDNIIANCNTGKDVYTVFQDGTDTFFSGFAQWFYDKRDLDVVADPFKLNFKIRIMQS